MLALGAAVNWQAISNRTAKLSSLCTELKNFSQNADAYRKAELRSQELQEFRMGRPLSVLWAIIQAKNLGRAKLRLGRD
jgi:hypothetical protein